MTTATELKNIDCPHCKGKIDVEIERKPAKVVMRETEDVPITELEAIAERVYERKQQKEKPKAEEKPLEKIEVRLPSWEPAEPCADGSCGIVHKNKHYKQKVTKRCANGDCKQFAPAKAAKCAWCGSKDLDKEDRFEDLDEDTLALIPDPEHEHTHEH